MKKKYIFLRLKWCICKLC